MAFWKKLIAIVVIFLAIFGIAVIFGVSPGRAVGWIGLIIAMFIRGDAAILVWRAAGKPFWQACLVNNLVATITLIATYFITGLAKKVVTHDVVKGRWQRTKLGRIFSRWMEKLTKKTTRWIQKMVDWLSGKRLVIVFVLNLIPLVPYLPTAIIIVVKLKEIKYGFLILFISNTIRCFLSAWLIWQGISLFSFF